MTVSPDSGEEVRDPGGEARQSKPKTEQDLEVTDPREAPIENPDPVNPEPDPTD